MFFNRGSTEKKLTIAVFISSRGSNMEAILRAIRDGRLKHTAVALVVADNADAKGLEIAKSFGAETMYLDCAPFKTKLDGAAEERIISILREKNVDLICLAGFMRMIKRGLINAFRNRIINIHPSLLPAFPGLDAQAQAVAAKAKVSGCTIHFVDEGMDSGPIIRQAKVRVKKDDTEKTLASRILKKEHALYWRVLRDIVRGRVRIGA